MNKTTGKASITFSFKVSLNNRLKFEQTVIFNSVNQSRPIIGDSPLK